MNETSKIVFNDGKDPDALRTIGEVADAIGLKQHILRYWEQQFPMLQPLKRSGNRRYYRPEDVQMVATIDRLVNHEGYTLKGAAQAIKSGNVAKQPTAPVSAAPEPVAEQPNLVPQLRAIREKLATALAA